MSEWREVALGDLIEVFDHKRIPLSSAQRSTRQGSFPYYGAQGVIDYIDDFIFDGRFILIPEDGENLRSRKLPIAYFAEGRFWVNNHAHIVRARSGVAVDRFVQAALQASDIGAYVTGAAQPKLSQANLRQIPVRLPSLEEQHVIAIILDALDDLIDNNRRRMGLLEQMVEAIYREWFVCFRYPGQESTEVIDSSLGPIPEGWKIGNVAELASAERNAVTGGPFGSRLGRKDYVDTGVPVLRGGNLRVGGGFDECELVYVSDDKADELRSSLARRGDVVVTQRGTLGQVGLIPAGSLFDRYLLSQSQMKITLDPARATAEFVYAQLRTKETTDRFIAQAMSSGVPHVNLALLRAFELVVPPIELQHQFSEAIAGPTATAWLVREENRRLAAIRDLLLPKLVSGEIDVSNLDLDALVGSAG